MMIKKLTIVLSLVSIVVASDIEDIKNSMMLNYIEQTKNISQINKENKQLIKQNSIYYTNIANKAREYYKGYIGEKWGEDNVKLSSKKTFTQYGDDLKSREHIDFEKGEVTLEVLTDVDAKVDVKVFDEKLKNLKSETVDEAMQKDPVTVLSTKYLKKKEIISSRKIKHQKEQFLKNLISKTNIKIDEIKQKIVKFKDGKKKKIVFITVKMVPKHLEKRAKRYKQDVLKEAKRFGVTPSHIFATIQTESYFNPLAISHIPAYGLMQIVPTTAGKDAYLALKGKSKLLAPEYLYDAKNNIEIGTQYIQIIKDRYLKGIKDPKTLFYCTATAYNAGIGTLIKSFTRSYAKRKEAINIINSMTADEVYTHLRTSKYLNKEAKAYVKKIKMNSLNYVKWDAPTHMK